MKKILYTEKAVEHDVREMISDIRHDKYEPEIVIGIGRGGVIPGFMFSYKMKLPFEVVTWQTRDGNIKDEQKIVNLLSKYNRILIVDDINDSGKTFLEIQTLLNCFVTEKHDIRTAALIHNMDSVYTVRYAGFVIHKDNDMWIDFYWEDYDGKL
ncbi:xanthine-guanine phosphoribosyltransferase [Synechococcus phage BUCT-ZZ01]|nr:xanthine-guanine phosphoribosyltransferase [Synechococcus phage BUCT-ZZ01]